MMNKDREIYEELEKESELADVRGRITFEHRK